MNHRNLIFVGLGLAVLYLIAQSDTKPKVEPSPAPPAAEATPTPKERSQAYQEAILETFTEMADSYDEISHVTLDGSILDVHYARRVSLSQFKQDAAGIAMSFSKKKKDLLGVSGVTVRCVYNDRIFAQASARRGEVTSLEP